MLEVQFITDITHEGNESRVLWGAKFSTTCMGAAMSLNSIRQCSTAIKVGMRINSKKKKGVCDFDGVFVVTTHSGCGL